MRLVIVLLTATLLAAGTVRADAGQSYEFGLWLQERGEYYRAVTEFQRSMFQTPRENTSMRMLAQFQVARTYMLGGEFGQAISKLENFMLTYPKELLSHRARLLLIRARLEREELDRAQSTIDSGLSVFDVEDRTPTISAYREEQGWRELRSFDIRGAQTTFTQLLEDNPGDQRLESLSGRVLVGLELRRKSPGLAGVLSAIVPGLGQTYNGRVGDGVAAFLVNGLFIWAAIAAYEEDMPEVAGVLGFMEIGWYGGNIYGAVNGARRFNRQQRDAYFGGLYRDFRLGVDSY